MRVEVDYAADRLELDLDADRVVGTWTGPPGLPAAALQERVRAALEDPLGYPPLRQAVVPGDRVVIPLQPGIPGVDLVLAALGEVLTGAGVETGSITVLATESGPEVRALPPGVALAVHDPADRARIAYLASTAAGRRVYLDRLLTDADVVLPVGRLGYDAVLGFRGPWGSVFPGLSDFDTQQAYRGMADEALPDPDRDDRPALAESVEVSWLLGSQFQVGVEVGVTGPAGILAGGASEVRAAARRSVAASWLFRTDRPAHLALAGVGVPWQPTTLDDLIAGVTTAARLVRAGGQVVVLSHARGTPGPALERLAQADDPRAGPTLLRGLGREPDYAAARHLATALASARIYLLSDLDPDLVEDLGMIPLAHPDEARRLVAAAPSSAVLSPAEFIRSEVAG